MTTEIDSKSDIPWEMIFGEKFIENIDPNEPANLPVLRAKSQKYKAAVKLFCDSGGDVYFEGVSKTIKSKIITCILADRTVQENRDRSCLMLDEIKRDLDFLCDIEAAVGQGGRI